MKIIETNLSEYFVLPNPGLLSYLHKVELGNPDDYRPPFWKGKSRAQVISSWDSVVQKLPAWKEYPKLAAYELEMREKIGPMSIQKPLKDRLSDVKSYFDDIALPSKPVASIAIDQAVEKLQVRGLRLKSQRQVLADMKLNTNSGNPYFTRRNTVVEDTVPVVISGDNQILNGVTYPLTAVLGWRGQEGGPKPSDVKNRVIWMMPFGLNVAELQAYQPLIAAVQKADTIPAWNGLESVDKAMTKLLKSATDDIIISTDFSKFDQHFNPHLQQAALGVLDQQFRAASDWDTWKKEVYPKLFNIPLLLDSRHITEPGCLHGVGSGGGGTNAVETDAHTALQCEVAYAHGEELYEGTTCLGDDGVISYPGITVEGIIQSYTQHGLEMNVDKQYVGEGDLIYLRRWHSSDYTVSGLNVGVYPTYRALGRLLAQERYYDPKIWGPEMVCLRAWSILENCKNSPWFEEFVDFVLKGDRYRLGLDIPGFFDTLEARAKEAMTEIPDFLGYTRSLTTRDDGITSWRIYSYLCKLGS